MKDTAILVTRAGMGHADEALQVKLMATYLKLLLGNGSTPGRKRSSRCRGRFFRSRVSTHHSPPAIPIASLHIRTSFYARSRRQFPLHRYGLF